MKISICCVGKVKESFFRGAIEEYSKRLRRYCKLEILEVADEKTKERASDAEEALVKKREAERLLRVIREDAYVIALTIDGTSYSSEAFANWLGQLGVNGVSHIQFVIGGSLGLHEDVIKRADATVSFSAMTFPHQLMRVILLEQIYRGYRIINGEPYHK
jgi:23S rRNA (pseudouridine1915-N3)-methyltransferase